ncbi:MAG: hypothetical protein P1P90_05200 [Patescibacteria group bacterium]|nr:hypothetical protein [Patescibacteria group bacterium]
MIFIYRLLPLLSAVFVAFSFWLQLQYPFQYPWIALVGVAVLFISAFLMSQGRVKLSDLMEKMLPTFIFLATLVFSLLLSESAVGRWIIICLGTIATYLSLELLFLLAFAPPKYPVHGLSRVNIAYVPIILFYAAATSVGLMTFIHTPIWIHITLMAVLGLVLFRTTGHPEATREQNNRWMLIGLILGLHLGFMGAVLPLSMYAQGAIAMLLFCGLLRMRRYLYHPLPKKAQAWVEGVAAVVLLIAILTTTRWL